MSSLRDDSAPKIMRYAAAIFCCTLLGIYMIFCIYYLVHTRSALLDDYLAAGGCFYRQEKFVTRIFTDQVKSAGNVFCLLSVPLIVFIAYFCYTLPVFNLGRGLVKLIGEQRRDAGWFIALLAVCISLAVYGHHYNALCTDEAFSALNFAGQPLARIITYYPIPNNHILYNVLNHFFSFFFGNAFFSGRILSSACYCLLIAFNFVLISRLTANRIIAFFCCIVLSLQFIVWGFGHQGRGYALCHLMEWGSFFSFYYYFFSAGQRKKEALTILFFCTVAGMWTVPVLLYLWVFQIVTAIVLMLKRRHVDLAFWAVMLASGAGIFLVYLPVFCYSGIDAVLGNGYNTGKSLSEIWQLTRNYTYDLLVPQTFGFAASLKPLALFLFVLPFILYLLFRARLQKMSGLLFLYGMLWMAMLIMILSMKQFPVMRGIGFYMHYSLLMVLLSLAYLAGSIRGSRVSVRVLLAGVLTIAAVRMFYYNRELSRIGLYGQDTRSFLNSLEAFPQDFKAGASIWLSDESFMWPFVLKDLRGVSNYDCNFRHQDIIFLSEDDKPLPETVMTNYIEKGRAGWFVIYEHK